MIYETFTGSELEICLRMLSHFWYIGAPSSCGQQRENDQLSLHSTPVPSTTIPQTRSGRLFDSTTVPFLQYDGDHARLAQLHPTANPRCRSGSAGCRCSSNGSLVGRDRLCDQLYCRIPHHDSYGCRRCWNHGLPRLSSHPQVSSLHHPVHLHRPLRLRPWPQRAHKIGVVNPQKHFNPSFYTSVIAITMGKLQMIAPLNDLVLFRARMLIVVRLHSFLFFSHPLLG